MDRAGILKAFALMSSLWTNYRPPATADDIDAAVSGWLIMLGNATDERVHRAICEYSAAGHEFAPQVGQVYEIVRQAMAEERFIRASCVRLMEINKARSLAGTTTAGKLPRHDEELLHD
ncbi:MAG: hypothetical protein RSA70_07090 [Clostridia bacterium]